MYSSCKFSSMMFSSLMVVVMLQMLLLQTAAQVDVSVSPAQIDVGLSPSLDLNCTFSMSSSTMTQIVSLTVVREINYTELASITTFSDHQANVISSEGITADGVINSGGQSYIHLHWDYPTDTQNGTYLCIARGVDVIGHDIETVNTSVVSVNQPVCQDLADELIQIRQELQQMQTSFSQEIQQKEIYITELEYNISTLSVQKENQFDLSSVFIFPPLSYNDTRYFVSKVGLPDFNETITTCKAYGGILAEVNDLDEYQAIQDYVKTLPSDVNNVFLGGTDEGHAGKWVLPSSGEELPAVDWTSGEPTSGDQYNCLSLYIGRNWQMWAYYCHADDEILYISDRFMCEI